MQKDKLDILLQEDDSEALVDLAIHKSCMFMYYGSIQNTDGKGISNATIKLVDQKLNPIMHTISSKDGSFVLMPSNKGPYQLIIAKSGYTTLCVKSITHHHSMHFVLNKICKHSCDVIGQCFYNNGTFAKNVVILLDQQSYRRTTLTDQFGCFAFLQLDSGLHTLDFLGEVCEPDRACFEIYHSEHLINFSNVCLQKKDIGCTLHGTVKNQDNIPISNALVLLYCSRCGEFIKKTNTNLDGIYFFGNLNKGSYYIKAIY